MSSVTASAAIPASRSDRSRALPSGPVSFLHTLGHDETFWVGIASVQAALTIALVVEGRTALEQFEAAEQRLDDEMHKQTDRNEELLRKLEQDWRLKLPHWRRTVSAPSLVVPRGHDPAQPERRRRIAAAALALPVLAIGLVAALLAMSPVPYVGAVPVAITGALAAASIGLALWVLVGLSVLRITGMTLHELFGRKGAA
jgi:hypothetical protein